MLVTCLRNRAASFNMEAPSGSAPPVTRLGCLVVFALLCVTTVTGQGNQVLTYQVTEELSPQTPLGNISIDSGLLQSASDPSKLRFSIIPESGVEELFYIADSQYGELRTKQVIDREAICAYQKDCFVPLDILVRSTFDVIKARVKVLDINDNDPVFQDNPMQRTINELSGVGTTISLDTATDSDSPEFGVKSYNLSKSDTFTLRQTVNAQGEVEISLFLLQNLDREQTEDYSVVLTAFDGGLPTARSGSVEVKISVIDVNDNPPIFKDSSYEVTVKEDVNQPDGILQVTATDLDSGTGGEIVYSFDQNTQREYGELFSIDQATGEIFVMGRLDYETHHQYVLIVEAKNPDPSSQTAATRVTVTVEDVNDNAPVITVTTVGGDGGAISVDGAAEVSEWSEIGAFVARVSVTDADEGINGEVTCQMDNDHFKVVKNPQFDTEFQVVTKALLNRESASSYKLVFVCTDKGTPGKASTRVITVHVKDENDNAPIFSQGLYGKTLAENNKPGAFILQVSAWDEDEGSNAAVSYILEDPEMANLFHLDPISGNLTAVGALDYEANSQIELTILAVDHGSPSLNTSALALIKIEDVDDEPPVFDQDKYSLSVFENEPPTTDLSDRVTATDRDSEKYNKFSYSIDSNSPDGKFFNISANSGKITTRVTFDREEQAVYNFVVVATGAGPEPKTGTASVTVYIVDKNDHSPVITYPNPYNNTVYVINDAPNNKIVARILAHDADGGPNAQLSYYILDGNVGGCFSVDEQSGAIYVNCSLKDMKSKLFGLIIQVRDNGDLKRNAEVMIKVVIKEAEDSVSNLTIVIAIAAAAGFIIIILCIAIAVVLCRQKADDKKKYNHMPRYMDQKSLSSSMGVRGSASTAPSEHSEGAYFEKPQDEDLGYYNRGAATGDESADGHASFGSDSKEFDIVDDGTKSPVHMIVVGPEHRVHHPIPYQPDTHRSPPPSMGPRGPQSVDKDSDSGCSADMSQTSESRRGSHGEADNHLNHLRLQHQNHHNYQSSPPPKIPPRGLSRSRPLERPPPIPTKVLPPGVHNPHSAKRTPSSSSDNPLLVRPPADNNPYPNHRAYASFNDGWNKQRPMVSMDTREYGQRYGPQKLYHPGNQMNNSYDMQPRNFLRSIQDDDSEMSLEASQV